MKGAEFTMILVLGLLLRHIGLRDGCNVNSVYSRRQHSDCNFFLCAP